MHVSCTGVFELIQIPVWQDNYAYLVVHGDRALVVDAPDASGVLEALEARPGVRLEAVVNTHHHPDHVGGNLALARATGCSIVGPARDAARIPGLTQGVDVGERIELAGVGWTGLDVRAHTRGHIAFRSERDVERVTRHGHDGRAVVVARLGQRPILFVGDSLFLGGCGRLFEGSAADLLASMTVLAAQDPRSLICCAHEYTTANFRFAAHVFSGSAAIAERLDALGDERADSGSSVPDTLARELATNPFLLALREEHRAIVAPSLGVSPGDPAAVLGALRAAKDVF